jgi:AMP deaminase
MYGNLCTLDSWRGERGITNLYYDPHCGDAGNTEHLTAALLAPYGILLRNVLGVLYLYHLAQIGKPHVTALQKRTVLTLWTQPASTTL